MNASVNAFLDQIIDYAGLFPPAKLPLEEALRNYLRIQDRSQHRSMLGRFVCPAARLQELSAAAGQPVRAVALGRPSSTSDELLTALQADVNAIENYREVCDDERIIDTLEFPLPKGSDLDSLRRIWPKFVADLERAKLRAFVEAPPGPGWRALVAEICGCWNDSPVGLKLRCGGVATDAFPSDADVAFIIATCRRFDEIAWKATAGLHHPRRHWDAALKVWHHGFLNVFAAGVLAWTHALTESDIIELLADRELRDLRFEPDRMIWRNWSCNTAQIAEARAIFATSFGSCSFDEPCEDLIAMGLLDSDRAQ